MIVKNATFGSIQNNCYLVVDEKTNCSALVDCTECSQKMLDFIGDTDLKYIFLTHGHFDHITGVKGVKEKYGSRVVISHEDAPMLSSAKLSLAAFCGGEQNIVEPDILVADGDVVKLNDIEFKVISTPGHTKGGVCYLVGDYIFTGDTLFAPGYGRTDLPGGSWSDLVRSLRRLLHLPGNLHVYPGHGGDAELSALRGNL